MLFNLRFKKITQAITLVLFLFFSLNGFSQRQCYHCLIFRGDSISIDSTIQVSDFPFIIDTTLTNNLSDGRWASVSISNQQVILVFDIKNNKFHGKVFKFSINFADLTLNKQPDFEEYNFIEGKAHGKYIRWRDYFNKLKGTEGFYSNNKKDSTWNEYYIKPNNNTLFHQSNYQNGVLHGFQKEWFENGKLCSQKNCIKGKYIGNAIDYYPNGKIAKEYVYQGGFSPFVRNYLYVNTYDSKGNSGVVDGNGAHTIVHINGEIWKQGPVENGKRHGIWKVYSSSGALQKTESYENGVKVN